MNQKEKEGKNRWEVGLRPPLTLTQLFIEDSIPSIRMKIFDELAFGVYRLCFKESRTHILVS